MVIGAPRPWCWQLGWGAPVQVHNAAAPQEAGNTDPAAASTVIPWPRRTRPATRAAKVSSTPPPWPLPKGPTGVLTTKIRITTSPARAAGAG